MKNSSRDLTCRGWPGHAARVLVGGIGLLATCIMSVAPVGAQAPQPDEALVAAIEYLRADPRILGDVRLGLDSLHDERGEAEEVAAQRGALRLAAERTEVPHHPGTDFRHVLCDPGDPPTNCRYPHGDNALSVWIERDQPRAEAAALWVHYHFSLVHPAAQRGAGSPWVSTASWQGTLEVSRGTDGLLRVERGESLHGVGTIPWDGAP